MHILIYVNNENIHDDRRLRLQIEPQNRNYESNISLCV